MIFEVSDEEEYEIRIQDFSEYRISTYKNLVTGESDEFIYEKYSNSIYSSETGETIRWNDQDNVNYLVFSNYAQPLSNAKTYKINLSSLVGVVGAGASFGKAAVAIAAKYG